eukprot:gene6803-8440_t
MNRTPTTTTYYSLNWVLPDRMVFPSIVATAGIGLWTLQSYRLGVARQKYNVKAPIMTGDPEFEKIVHSYHNTVEALPAIIPSTFIFSYFISPKWALILGSSWIVSRMVYCCNYCCGKEKDCDLFRKLHVLIGHGSQFLLLAGSAFGIGVSIYNRSRAPAILLA